MKSIAIEFEETRLHAQLFNLFNLSIIGQLHVSENILIDCLIALTSRLDALDARKNVLQPMGICRSTGIKQLSKTKHTV